MALPISVFSTWATGILNGLQHNRERLPAAYSYTAMSLTTGIGMVKVLGSQQTPITNPGGLLAGLFIGIPIMVGSIYCSGTMLGISIRHSQDKGDKS